MNMNGTMILNAIRYYAEWKTIWHGPFNYCLSSTWWRHHMEHFCVTGRLCGEFTGHRRISHTNASDAALWCFHWSALNKRLRKQSWGWWFEPSSCSLWRHCNDQGNIEPFFSRLVLIVTFTFTYTCRNAVTTNAISRIWCCCSCWG